MNVFGKVGVTLKKSMQFNSFFLLLATFKEERENAQRTVSVAISNMNLDKLSNKLSSQFSAITTLSVLFITHSMSKLKIRSMAAQHVISAKYILNSRLGDQGDFPFTTVFQTIVIVVRNNCYSGQLIIAVALSDIQILFSSKCYYKFLIQSRKKVFFF